MSALGHRLLLPAKQFFRLASDAKITAILVGGGASRLNGSNRFTKDLDINVSSFSFLKKYKGSEFLIRQGSSHRMMVVTYRPDDRDSSVRCDVGLHTNLENLLPYTKVDEPSGIRYSGEYLLLASKIRTFVERSILTQERKDSDLDDILHLTAEIFSWSNPRMPDELKKLFLPKDVTDSFWNQINIDHPDQREFLENFVRPIIE